MKILFSDDDPKLHLIVNMWLKKNGHDVTVVANGRDALELLQRESFDVLLSDVNMPLMNGIELVGAVLELPKPPALIVLMTGRCDVPELRQAIDAQRVHLFSKPFSPQSLVELLQQHQQENTPT